MRAVETNELPAAAEKSDGGLDGVVGGMMVIELLAGKMRLDRGGIVAVEDDMRQTYTVKHIRKGLTLLSYIVATYGWSLCALVCVVSIVRWTAVFVEGFERQ